MVNTDPSLKICNLTIDYSSGHVLVDGKPIGCFVAEQGPEVLRSPAEDLYIVNVPLMVESVTFLPSGERVEPARGVHEAWRKMADSFRSVLGEIDPRVPVSDVRLALVQALPKDHAARERVLELLKVGPDGAAGGDPL